MVIYNVSTRYVPPRNIHEYYMFIFKSAARSLEIYHI